MITKNIIVRDLAVSYDLYVLAGNNCCGQIIRSGYYGYEGLNKDMFFRIKNDSITRGHSLALVKSHSRLDIRKYTFSQRVVNDWNKLPEECINATSVNMFKNKIDQYYLKTRRE